MTKCVSRAHLLDLGACSGHRRAEARLPRRREARLVRRRRRVKTLDQALLHTLDVEAWRQATRGADAKRVEALLRECLKRGARLDGDRIEGDGERVLERDALGVDLAARAIVARCLRWRGVCV
jgi:hypothetical protein